jgi:ATP-dependent Zn protease
MTRISTKKYPRATAFHEAGHAVVAWSLGLPVGVIRVSDDDASGGTEIGPADHLSLTEQIAVWSAGHAAERLFECPAHELADARDRHEILKLLRANGISEEQGPALRDQGYDSAKRCLETYRSKVITLADRLVERGSVDTSEFARLMDGNAS